MQEPGVPLEQEGEAVTVAREMCDTQLKTWNAEIKLRKKRAAVPTYVKILIPPVLLLSIILCVLAITSAPLTLLAFIDVCICAGVLSFAWTGSAFLSICMQGRSLLTHTHCSSLHQQPCVWLCMKCIQRFLATCHFLLVAAAEVDRSFLLAAD